MRRAQPLAQHQPQRFDYEGDRRVERNAQRLTQVLREKVGNRRRGVVLHRAQHVVCPVALTISAGPLAG